MLDAVYVDAKQLKAVVAVKPKPPFNPIFKVAASKADADIRIVNEPYKGSPVFLVETGEASSIPETRVEVVFRWLDTRQCMLVY